jgi:hypothetical protein
MYSRISKLKEDRVLSKQARSKKKESLALYITPYLARKVYAQSN